VLEGTFTWHGRTLAYESYGEGDRVVVIAHGLLLDARSNRGVAERLAEQGFRVVCIDLLGHGRSDRPTHASEHRIDGYAEQVVALLDHLDVPAATLIGTSLGANASLFVAAHHPDRVRGLIIEMPVLEWAVPSAALVFAPMVLAVHYGAPVWRWLGRQLANVRPPLPILESVLDVVRADPDATAAVLHGILVGPVAPTVEQRRAITAPVLVLAHRADPIHPLKDAQNLARHVPGAKLVMARTPLELRILPTRIVGEMATFLDACWATDTVTAA
jgi:pimeloyl-ACP methyl ester carboxylesterase